MVTLKTTKGKNSEEDHIDEINYYDRCQKVKICITAMCQTCIKD